MVSDKHKEEIEFAEMFLSGDYFAEKDKVSLLYWYIY